MATYIDIITGFLESGKTTVINELLQSNYLEEFNKIILVVCEEGFTEYDEKQLEEMHVESLMLENESDLNESE